MLFFTTFWFNWFFCEGYQNQNTVLYAKKPLGVKRLQLEDSDQALQALTGLFWGGGGGKRASFFVEKVFTLYASPRRVSATPCSIRTVRTGLFYQGGLGLLFFKQPQRRLNCNFPPSLGSVHLAFKRAPSVDSCYENSNTPPYSDSCFLYLPNLVRKKRLILFLFSKINQGKRYWYKMVQSQRFVSSREIFRDHSLNQI